VVSELFQHKGFVDRAWEFVRTSSSSSLSQLPAPMMAVLSLTDKMQIGTGSTSSKRAELSGDRGPVESLVEEQDSDEDAESSEDEVEYITWFEELLSSKV